jgi:hypothetical protein
MNPANVPSLVAIQYSGSAETWQFIDALKELQAAYSELRLRKRDLQIANNSSFSESFLDGSSPDEGFKQSATTAQWAIDAQELVIDNVVIPKVEAFLSEKEKEQLQEPGKYIFAIEKYENSDVRGNTIKYGLYTVNNRYKVESGSNSTVLTTLIGLELAGTPYDSGMYIEKKPNNRR